MNANGKNIYNPRGGAAQQSYGNLFDLLNGTSGITFDTTAALGTIEGYVGLNKNVTLGVAKLPTLTGRAAGSLPTSGNGLFLNSSNSTGAQQAASWKFVQYLTAAAAVAKWDAATGFLPIRSDEVAAWKFRLGRQSTANNLPVAKWFEMGYSSMSTGRVDAASEGPLIGTSIAVNNDLAAALQALLTFPFTTTPAQAVSEASHNTTADILSYNQGV